jgi:hypothetical protein
MYSKKDLEVKFNLSDNTVYKTLQVCGLNTGKQEYSSEEIEHLFVPARQMLDAGKKYKQVKEYFALKRGGQAVNDEPFEEQEFDASGFASNQTTDATDTVSNMVAQTVADMVERSVKDIAPFIPALVVQTINSELNSGQIKAAFEQMRTQIKESKGSGAAFLLQKMQIAQANQNQLIQASQEPLQLPEASQEFLQDLP